VTRKKSAEVIEHRIIESMKLDKLVKAGNLNIEAYLSKIINSKTHMKKNIFLLPTCNL
jgi:hypothetical protein